VRYLGVGERGVWRQHVKSAFLCDTGFPLAMRNFSESLNFFIARTVCSKQTEICENPAE
jgi:hypothetical protein